MKKATRLLCILMLLFATALPARAEHFYIGGTKIQYTIPDTYVLAPDFFFEQMKQNFADATNNAFQCSVIYVSKEDYEKINTGIFESIHDYFYFAYLTEIEFKLMNRINFEASKPIVYKATTDQMKNFSVEDVTFNLYGEPVILENDDTEFTVAYVLLMTKNHKSGTMLATNSMFLIKGKFVFLQHFRQIDNDEDINEITDRLASIREHVIADNQ